MSDTRKELLIAFLLDLNPTVSREEIGVILTEPKKSFPVKVSKIPFDGLDQVDGQWTIKQVTDKILNDNLQFETEESRLAKDDLLRQLQAIVTKWSIDIAETEKQIYEEQLQNYKAILLPYGSQLLGVASQESDLDVICVAPVSIDRKTHFFRDLFAILEKQPHVTKINKIETSDNPIIKLLYKDSSVDINFAQLNRDTVPVNLDEELDDLRRTIYSTDMQSIHALNGRKNGLMIRNSVTNQNSFVDSLRIIKLWSKKRGISKNIVGYLGGISWAILVAKICQLFPVLNGHQIVYMFFKCYTLWDWSKPVIIDTEEKNDGFQQRDSLMSVMTPAYPYINSTQKVNLTNYKTIGKELYRGLEILEKETYSMQEKWEKLFEPYDLIADFKYFLTVSIVSKNEEDFHKWSGLCEAQLVQLQKLISQSLVDERYSDEYIYLDQQFVVLPQEENLDKFELRISQSGESTHEHDYAISNTYYIGIRKLDFTFWPMFLIIPVAKFAQRIMGIKNRSKWDPSDNIKIYFQNQGEVRNAQKSTPKKEDKRLPSQIDEYLEPSVIKKIKLDTHNSAELVRHQSVDNPLNDPESVNKALNELF